MQGVKIVIETCVNGQESTTSEERLCENASLGATLAGALSRHEPGIVPNHMSEMILHLHDTQFGEGDDTDDAFWDALKDAANTFRKDNDLD